MTEEKEPVLVALTGGIGSGKSTVANFIREMGFSVISTDDLAKDEYSNPEILKKLIKHFGAGIIENDKINHKVLSSLVFGPEESNAKNLSLLNSIVHPAVIDKMTKLLEEKVESGEDLVFVESALIYEAELEEGFDYVIAVSSPEIDSIKRAMDRTGLTRDEIQWRMDSQLPAKVKEDYADFTINNGGTLNDLQNASIFIVDILKDMVS